MRQTLAAESMLPPSCKPLSYRTSKASLNLIRTSLTATCLVAHSKDNSIWDTARHGQLEKECNASWYDSEDNIQENQLIN